jgi:cobalt-zinc-cadmium efflux system protein
VLSHFHASHGDAPKALSRALWITVLFMIVELVGGYLANSLALMSDAAHMLTDVGAMLLSLFVYWVTRRPTTPRMSFGYHRAEILGALASGLAIWVLAGMLIYEAVTRLGAPPAVQGPTVLGIAVFGLLANLLSMRILHSAQAHNLNVKAAYLHLLTDCMGSVGAIISGLVLWLADWRPIDPIVTLVSAALMVFSSWELVKESVRVLMESTPTHVDSGQVKGDLSSIEGVSEVHDLHIWAVSSGRLALSVHLVAPDNERVLAQANALLQERYGIIHTTIQIEHPERFRSERCYDCAHE